jgi:hypothetical protein
MAASCMNVCRTWTCWQPALRFFTDRDRLHMTHDMSWPAVLQSFKIVPKSEMCGPPSGSCSYTVTQQVRESREISMIVTDLADTLCVDRVHVACPWMADGACCAHPAAV